MADLLVGHTQDTTDAEGRNDIYVRLANENQSWHARGILPGKTTIGDWLDKTVMNVTRDRIATTTVTPATGPGYSVVRTSKDQPDFELLDMPKGRELAYPAAADTVATAITDFAFDDVAQAKDIDFTKASELTSRTFDGLIVTVKLAEKNGDHWVSLSASANAPAKEQEAMAINARAEGWAFKLPLYKAQMFQTTRDSLLKAPGGAAPTVPGAPPAFAPRPAPH
jgi:hypothetical protein